MHGSPSPATRQADPGPQPAAWGPFNPEADDKAINFVNPGGRPQDATLHVSRSAASVLFLRMATRCLSLHLLLFCSLPNVSILPVVFNQVPLPNSRDKIRTLTSWAGEWAALPDAESGSLRQQDLLFILLISFHVRSGPATPQALDPGSAHNDNRLLPQTEWRST